MQGHVLLRGLKGFRSEEGGLWVRFKKKDLWVRFYRRRWMQRRGFVGIIQEKRFVQPAREARRLAQRAERPFGPLGQSACFGAGCYIEMANSCH